MKAALWLAVFGLLAVIVQSELCLNHNVMNCTVQCTGVKRPVCEHEVCTCGDPCLAKSDCTTCQGHMDPAGHMINMEVHCMDGACVCEPHHQPPPNNNGHHHPPGGN